MSKFTKDARIDTMTIGLLNALALYFAYPLFVHFLSIAGLFADAINTPFLALVSIGALPLLLLFLALSIMPAAFSGIVTFSMAFIVRHAYRYRLQQASWWSLVNLGMAYSVISMAVFGAGFALAPPSFTDQERQVHEWLWPAGAVLLNVVLSIVSAAITYRLLRPTAPGVRPGRK
jgi:hypothetical protein